MIDVQNQKFPVYYAVIAVMAVLLALWYFYVRLNKSPQPLTPAQQLEAMENEVRGYLSDETKWPSDAQINSAEEEARKYLNSSQ